MPFCFGSNGKTLKREKGTQILRFIGQSEKSNLFMFHFSREIDSVRLIFVYFISISPFIEFFFCEFLEVSPSEII